MFLAKHISRILDAVTEISNNEELREEVFRVITAALSSTSSDLSVWMGSGRRALEHIWNTDPLLAINITGAIYEVGWKGFRQFALPPFLKGCIRILSVQQDQTLAGDCMLRIQTLRLLAKLAEDGLLKEADASVVNSLNIWVEKFVGSFQLSAESVSLRSSVVASADTVAQVILLSEIVHVTQLVDQEPLLKSSLSVVRNLLDQDHDVQQTFRVSWHNEAFALGTVLKTITKMSRSLKEGRPKVNELIYESVQKFGWSGYVLENLVDLARQR